MIEILKAVVFAGLIFMSLFFLAIQFEEKESEE